jgi:hypothetical protein
MPNTVKETVSLLETKAYIDEVHKALIQSPGYLDNFNAWTPLFDLFAQRRRDAEFWLFMGTAYKFNVEIEIAALICFGALIQNRTLFAVAENAAPVSPEVRQQLAALGPDTLKKITVPRPSIIDLVKNAFSGRAYRHLVPACQLTAKLGQRHART